MYLDPQSGEFARTSTRITLGARVDSAYEYLLKQWLLSGRTDANMRRMYDESMEAISRHLVRHGGSQRCGNCTYVGQWDYASGAFVEEMDHLVCFLPGLLALGAEGGSASSHLDLAARLLETCKRMWTDTPTGLAPEIADLSQLGDAVAPRRGAVHCLLRPETAESLLIMWRRTGERRYRAQG
jgi:mannosyl-oligosaccharide alpha-1,2-mannosidase